MTIEAHQKLIIDGIELIASEHPRAAGMPYGQEGRKAVVYQFVDKNQKKYALKVFRPRFRIPQMAAIADKLLPYAILPGLQVCERTVLTASRHPDLLGEQPDLAYAVLMPWVEGQTWQELILERKIIEPETSLKLAKSLAQVLVKMEEQGLAHCDLSGANLIITPGDQVMLVDLEEMCGPGFFRPNTVPSGSPGYGHRSAGNGLWGSSADRFSGALILTEMMGWCDALIVASSWGESYFNPEDLQRTSVRYDRLLKVIRNRWGERIADLLIRVWSTDTLEDCPTMAEWFVALPKTAEASSTGVAQDADEESKNSNDLQSTSEVLNAGRTPPPPEPQDEAASLYAAAIAAMNARRWSEAQELLQAVLNRDPGFSQKNTSAHDLLREVQRQIAAAAVHPVKSTSSIRKPITLVMLVAILAFWAAFAILGGSGSAPAAPAAADETATQVPDGSSTGWQATDAQAIPADSGLTAGQGVFVDTATPWSVAATTAPSSSSGVMSSVYQDGVYLRAGPNINHPAVSGFLAYGTPVEILAKMINGDWWFQVRLNDGNIGWLVASWVQTIETDWNQIPDTQVFPTSPPPMYPTETPVPTSAPRPPKYP